MAFVRLSYARVDAHNIRRLPPLLTLQVTSTFGAQFRARIGRASRMFGARSARLQEKTPLAPTPRGF